MLAVSPSKQTYLYLYPPVPLLRNWKLPERSQTSLPQVQKSKHSAPLEAMLLRPGTDQSTKAYPQQSELWPLGSFERAWLSLSLIDLADLILVQGPAETKAIFHIRHIASHFTTQWKDMESQDKQHQAPRLPNVLIWAHSSHISKLYWLKNHSGTQCQKEPKDSYLFSALSMVSPVAPK